MDIFSYLLGKQNGGSKPPVLIDKNITSNGTYLASNDNADGYKEVVVNVPSTIYPDWSQIGYNAIPQSIVAGFNYAKNIYDNWDSSITTMNSKYSNNYEIMFMPQVDTSNVTSMASAFYNCYNLQQVGQLNTSNITKFNQCFYGCNSLYEIPKLNFGKIDTINGAFDHCYSLKILGGFENLGKSYSTGQSTSYSKYKINLSECTLLTHDSLMNVINNLYDIATKGCNPQDLILGATNLAKLTAEEIGVATTKGWNVS